MSEIISKSLSDSDIRKALDNKINIVKYSELKDYKNIDQLLYPYDRVVILFEIEDFNNGHWTALTRNKNSVIFTDSYGIFPENELNYVPKSLQFVLKQDRSYLLKLLHNQPLPVKFSQFRLQKVKKGVNTCGRYAILRCILKDLDENEFAQLLKSTEYEPDELVSILTYDI